MPFSQEWGLLDNEYIFPTTLDEIQKNVGNIKWEGQVQHFKDPIFGRNTKK